MNLGGPVWHASAAPVPGCHVGKMDLRRIANVALAGVGDHRHEWVEWTGYAFHVRRRLTEQEEIMTGPAVDLRGTAEAAHRYAAALRFLPPKARMIAMQEINEEAVNPAPTGAERGTGAL